MVFFASFCNCLQSARSDTCCRTAIRIVVLNKNLYLNGGSKQKSFHRVFVATMFMFDPVELLDAHSLFLNELFCLCVKLNVHPVQRFILSK